MPLTDEDIDRIADAVTKKSKDAGFHIDPEAHYNQHKRIDRFLDMWEKANSIWTRIMLTLMALGAVALVILGIGMKGKVPA